jgi:hypothetical protein
MFKGKSRRRQGRLAASFCSVGFVAASLLGTSIFTPTEVRADVTDQLLDQLKAKGILTPAEYRTLKERHAAEVAAQRAAPPPPGRRLVTKEGVVIVPDDRYVTRLDKGIGIRVGQVDVKLSGELIFFGAEQFKQQGTAIVAGGLGGGSLVNNSNSIRSGLLPSSLTVALATNQMGYDLGFTASAFVGGNNANVGLLNANNGGAAVGLGTSGIDFRQIFGTIGSPTFGTVKIGRDLGLFGADAILLDFTLLGVGTPAGNRAPANTSLGRIGIGYVYADWIPQITYTTPNYYGFTASVGAFTPYQEFNFSGLSGTMTGHDQPGFQGRLKWVGNVAENVKLTAWTTGLTQLHRAEVGDAVFVAPGTSTRAYAVDGGAKFDIGPVSVLGYGYYGNGLGTTALYFDGISVDGLKRKSYGWYAQGAYTFFDRLQVGGSYGISYLKGNAIDFSFIGGLGTLVYSNASYIGFAKYKFTDWVNFQGEYIHSISRNQLGGQISTDAVVLGTTFFF